MSQTHTIVVRFPEGIVPRYSAATEFQGGQVVAVDFDGNRLHVCQELEEALEELLSITSSHLHMPSRKRAAEAKARAALELAQGISRGEMPA